MRASIASGVLLLAAVAAGTASASTPKSGPEAGDTLLLEGGVRDPAVAADGRAVVSVRGDLWLLPDVEGGAPPVRLTRGPGWDRQPAWTEDGRRIVFSSDRAGSFDLWAVSVPETSAIGAPARLTALPGVESHPAVAPDGAIAFVRGRGAEADIWLLDDGGAPRAVVTAPGGDHEPTFSPRGDRLAYVHRGLVEPGLRVTGRAGATGDVIVPEGEAEAPAWSPDGHTLAYAIRGEGLFAVSAAEGGATPRLIDSAASQAAWRPDGASLLVSTLPLPEPSYNGDPDRRGDRGVGDYFPDAGRLFLVPVSSSQAGEGRALDPSFPVQADDYALQVLTEIGLRVARVHLSERAGALEAWNRAQARHRGALLAARSEDELEEVVHELLGDRPHLKEPARGRAGVASSHPLATEAGLSVLGRGGNAVDAAVAVSFALGVVEPDASGVGGYGQMLVYLRGMEAPVTIEFLTRVPEDAGLGNNALTDGSGELPPDGPVLANVPGAVAGMRLAWERYGSGRVGWAELLEPARRLARDGFMVDDAFATTLSRERERFLKHASTRDLFFPGGEPLAAGDTLRNPGLAWVLGEIAAGGAHAFYRGSVARRMVDDLRGRGNVMTLRDLDRYYAVERVPVRISYRGHTVFGSAPATTGGAGLAAKLGLLAQARLGGRYPADPATLHTLIEAWKLAPSTRGRIGDPGLWPVNLVPFQSPDTASARWACFREDRAIRPPTSASEIAECSDGDDQADATHSPGGGPGRDRVARAGQASGAGEAELQCALEPSRAQGRCRAQGTTSFALGDADGNLVAVTQTLGTWGGNFYVSPGLGFIYNDKLRSYGRDPEGYNARIPFARNVTNISPTLVFKGEGPDAQPFLALGAAGNAWIASAVYQALVGIVDHGLGAQAAVELPRFLVRGNSHGDDAMPVVQYERGIHPRVVERLRSMGHRLQPISLTGELRMGYASAVMILEGEVEAAADPRRSGAAGALR